MPAEFRDTGFESEIVHVVDGYTLEHLSVVVGTREDGEWQCEVTGWLGESDIPRGGAMVAACPSEAYALSLFQATCTTLAAMWDQVQRGYPL